jgi:hypothetical protein
MPFVSNLEIYPMPKVDVSDRIFEGALIVHGLIPQDDLWNELIGLLNEIEDLPQPMPWNGLCAWDVYISVHRKTLNGHISPPLEWATSALDPASACAAIAFKCKPSAEDSDRDFFNDFSESLFHDLVRTFSYAANIARPGSFGVQSIVTRGSDGSCKTMPGFGHDLDGAIDYSKKTGWPPLVSVPFGDAWVWIVRNLFHMRPGDTPVSRAFNAYTWLFEKRSDFPFGLVAALIGIEALYTTTTSGVGDQVRRRVQLFLGSRTTFKNDLDKMYSARSAFLHGATLLSPNGFSWVPSDAVEAKLEKISDAEDIASAVLVSSLQRLVEKGWTTLEFSENLIGSGKSELESIEEIVRGASVVYAIESEIDEWVKRFIRRFD